VRIAGVDRLIRTVNLTDGIITFSPSAPTNYTTASLIYGLVVDNTVVESGTTLGTISNDDGDQMVESVVKSGGDYTWDAAIKSLNIPDGPITLYYVAYDKAGNSVSGSVSSSVANSRPRIAKVLVGTDLDGNGSYSSSEVTTVFNYSDRLKSPSVVSVGTDFLDPNFTMKDKLAVLLDIVGGNGTKKYVWEAGAAAATAQKTSATPTSFTSIPVAGGATYAYGIELLNSSMDGAWEGAKKYFAFTIWDSTDETTIGTDSQWALLNVPVTVDVVDNSPPTASITPFYWNSASDNSLYQNSRDNGHIELTGVITPTQPNVSGQVSIRGKAFDDQRLSKLYMSIDGFEFKDSSNVAIPKKGINTGTYALVASRGITGTATPAGDSLGFTDAALVSKPNIAIGQSIIVNGVVRTISSWNSGSGAIAWSSAEGTVAGTPGYAYTINAWDVADSFASRKWRFVITSDTLDQSGHNVTWRLDWDSSEVTNVAAKNCNIRVEAEDRSNNAADESTTQTKDGDLSPLYIVDIVPYITKVSTSLGNVYSAGPSVYSRTAQGSYPVYEGETIGITGFNLYKSASTAVVLNTTAITPTAPTTTYMSLPVGTTATSGKLTITVSGVDSVNNSNSNTEDIHKLPNGLNNDILTDDVKIDIWQFTTAATPRDGEILQPEMAIGPTGKIGLGFVNGNFYFCMPGLDSAGANFMSQRPIEKCYAPYSESAICFDAKGNTYGISTNQDANTNYSAYTTFFFDRVGGNAMSMNGNYAGGTYRRRLESTTSSVVAGVQDTSVFRAQSPTIAASMPDATHTYVYLAYYDAINKTVRYRWGSIGTILEKACSVTLAAGTYAITNVDNTYYLHDNGGYFAVNNQVKLYNSSGTLLGSYFILSKGGTGADFYYTIGTTLGGTRIAPPATASLWVKQANTLTLPTTINCTGHGFLVGDAVTFIGASNTYNEPTLCKVYYVRTTATNSFTVTDTIGGATDVTVPCLASYVSAIGGQLIDIRGGYSADNGTTPVEADASSYTVVADSSSTSKRAGKYVSLGVVPKGTSGLSDDAVVMTWYDATSKSLVYTYNTDPRSDDSANWQSNSVVIDSAGGMYNKIKVDSDGGIHIAYYSTSGADLKYAYFDQYDHAASKLVVTVDSYQLVGTQISLDVAKNGGHQVPYISYYMASQTMAKMAYRTDFSVATPNGVVNDKFTGYWEVGPVPETRNPKDDTICIGVFMKNGALDSIPPASYASTLENSDSIYSTTVGGNGTTNPVMAYTIQDDDSLQLAQKK
jgi:hypothetical protein